VRQLSLGERMRCELVASLLHSPRILFLDEPTIGLDVSAKAVIRELLRTASERERVTLLLTSHDTGDIERVCTRVIVIHHGRLLWDGAVAELRRGYLKTKRITLWTEAECPPDAARVRVPSPPHGPIEIAETTPFGQVVSTPRCARPRSGISPSRTRRLTTSSGPCTRPRNRTGDVMTRLVAKYAAFSRVAVARACRERGDLYGRVVFFAVILGVFSSLWRAAAEAGLGTATDPRTLVWYLAVTEWIVLSTPQIHLDIQRRSAPATSSPSRPVSPCWRTGRSASSRCGCRCSGSRRFACVRFTGGFRRARALAIVALSVWRRALPAALHVWIGLRPLAPRRRRPYGCAKLMFVLGGLMLPLEIIRASFNVSPDAVPGAPRRAGVVHAGKRRAAPATLARATPRSVRRTAVGLG
jgi:hypothetical protein